MLRGLHGRAVRWKGCRGGWDSASACSAAGPWPPTVSTARKMTTIIASRPRWNISARPGVLVRLQRRLWGGVVDVEFVARLVVNAMEELLKVQGRIAMGGPERDRDDRQPLA